MGMAAKAHLYVIQSGFGKLNRKKEFDTSALNHSHSLIVHFHQFIFLCILSMWMC